MNDIQLSKHFRLSEFTRSATATARKIDNTPSIDIVSNLQHLCIMGLEPLREEFGCPITITSGYRSPSLNAAVGGAANSNHLHGYAADIRTPDNTTGMKWFEWIRTHLVFDELIAERQTANSTSFWIHLAIRQGQTNRMRVTQNMIKNK